MSTIADWLMVGITAVYVIATIVICIFNGKSAKASREQIDESQRQFEDTKRLGAMPFLQLEIPVEQKSPLFEIELDLFDEEATDHIYKIVKLKNLGNGSASNIIYTWERGKGASPEYDYPPINAIMHGDCYCFQLTIFADESAQNGTSGELTWQYDDLLGNSYEQNVTLVFENGDLVRCENDTPRFLGLVGYKLADSNSSEKSDKEEKK